MSRRFAKPLRTCGLLAAYTAALLWTTGCTGKAEGQAKQGAPAKSGETILFVGNSFTYGSGSAAKTYGADEVTDLNNQGHGGVPALFKRFTQEAGLNYRVSLETSGGKTLGWHWDTMRGAVDGAWDHVVLQDFSTINPERPGDPATLVDYTGRFASLFASRNPKVDVSLYATWSRADLTYPGGAHWSGKPITRMALDIREAYDLARKANPQVRRIHPVGQAFNCAIATGLADGNPYDGIQDGKLDLWGEDHYHASSAGYYLAALTIFAGITGKDPRMLGRSEKAAADLGIAPDQTEKLQAVAWQVARNDGQCDKAAERP